MQMTSHKPATSHALLGTVVRNFSSQWFLITQGTGITAVILHQLPYQFRGLEIISEVLWVYTIVLFLLMLTIYAIRASLCPRQLASALSTNLSETACLASISITFTTIIQMIALTLVHEWGSKWGIVAYVLWWMNMAMSATGCIGISYVSLKLEAPRLSAVPPVILLAPIAAITSAAGGGIICQYGALSDRLQVPVIVVSYLLLGLALPLSLAFEAVLLSRMFGNAFPTKQETFQIMILCGPLGQGSFALQILGQVVQSGSFAEYDRGVLLTNEAAGPLGYASEFLGLVAWGYATFWWGFAVLSLVREFIARSGEIRKSDFSIAAWSIVFPSGVYTNAAIQLGALFDSAAFKVWSTALTIVLLAVWLTNTVMTIKGIVNGKLLGLNRGWKKGADRDEKGGEEDAHAKRVNKARYRINGEDEMERGQHDGKMPAANSER